MAGGLAIDWCHPGLQPWAAWGQVVEQHLDEGLSMAQAIGALVATLRIPMHHPYPQFVPSADCVQGLPYEVHVQSFRTVPTRDNWHDGFNAFCWLRLPELKWHFNRIQAQFVTEQGVGATRGPVRDAITVLDENGLLLQAPDALWEAVVARHWNQAFVHLRHLWAESRWVVLGHALLEQLIQPYKGLTAHVLRWPTEWGTDESRLAQGMAAWLTPEVLASKPFVPLPVMGLPGWMPGQDAGFFSDQTVFRPAKHQTRTRQLDGDL